MFLSFGKKKRKSVKRSVRKPPAALLRKCRKYRVKTTIKRGRKRVYKKVSVLKKELSKKMKKAKKAKKTKRSRRSTGRKVIRRRFNFGSSGAPFVNSPNFGYNQAIPQAAGTLSQSSQVVSDINANQNRPPGFGLDTKNVPTFGVYRPFFTENVPCQVGPSWNFMGQPDGSEFPVGGPFSGFSSFGRRRCGPGKKRSKRDKRKCVSRRRRGRFGSEAAKTKAECPDDGNWEWTGTRCKYVGG